MSKFFEILLTAFVALILGSCQHYTLDDLSPEAANKVKLVIQVYAGDPDNPASRADDEVGPPNGGYLPGTTYEKMHSLRVIIVRPDGTVEHNEHLWRSIPEQGVSDFPNIRFNVIGGETKKVYLFANEASMFTAPGSQTPFNFDAYPTGSKFSAADIADVVLRANPAEPLIDNTGASKSYVPMSEVFDVYVDAPTDEEEMPETRAQLFITRATVKFSFYFSTAETPNQTYSVDEIEISSLADTEYLLPRNASYTPAKSQLGRYDRYIYAYDVPAAATNSPIVFKPRGIEFSPSTKIGEVQSYEPALYYFESKLGDNSNFNLRLRLSDNTEYTGSYPLDELPILPRNTWVKVNVTFASTDIHFTVDVLPYTSVPLNPDFGFDDLLPRPPLLPGEVPPWITIDPSK